MIVREYFSLADFARSQTAARLGIDNTPPKDTLPAVKAMVKEVLLPAMRHFGAPININSGYRCKALNDAIGGSKTSQHMWTPESVACDIESVDGSFDNLSLAYWIRDNCVVDQLISECYDPAEGPSSGWVHVSFRTDGRNRQESLTYQRGKGYSNGLPAR
jgi:hypothetical protein